MQAVFHCSKNNSSCAWLILCYCHLSTGPSICLGQKWRHSGTGRETALRVVSYGGRMDALGFEWHVAGLAPGQASKWPERHVPARARTLSSWWDITYEAYFMPFMVASLAWMSCQCHRFLLNLELSSSWEVGASAWRQDIAYHHLGSSGGWFSKLLLSCYPLAFVWGRKKCFTPHS